MHTITIEWQRGKKWNIPEYEGMTEEEKDYHEHDGPVSHPAFSRAKLTNDKLAWRLESTAMGKTRLQEWAADKICHLSSWGIHAYVA